MPAAPSRTSSRRRASASARSVPAVRAGAPDRRHRAHGSRGRDGDALSRPQRRADAPSGNGPGGGRDGRGSLDRLRRPGARARSRRPRPHLRRGVPPAARARVRARGDARRAARCGRILPLRRERLPRLHADRGRLARDVAGHLARQPRRAPRRNGRLPRAARPACRADRRRRRGRRSKASSRAPRAHGARGERNLPPRPPCPRTDRASPDRMAR